MENIGEILKEAGTDYEHVVKTTCFLADMVDFGAFNGVYEKYFTGKPARSCVAVTSQECSLRGGDHCLHDGVRDNGLSYE